MALAGSYLDRDELKTAIGGVVGVRAQLVDGTFIANTAQRDAWVLFVESRLKIRSAEINARLRKRYAVPFAEPFPEMVKGWLSALVLPDLHEARGWDPTDAQAEAILGHAERARTELEEAANAEIGLYDLPLRQDTTETGITKGGPLGYSEASPYAWLDVQAADVAGGGR